MFSLTVRATVDQAISVWGRHWPTSKNFVTGRDFGRGASAAKRMGLQCLHENRMNGLTCRLSPAGIRPFVEGCRGSLQV